MRSLYDAVFDTLTDATFSIPDVSVRKPYDGTDKTYPLIVVHEIVNLPKPQGTVNGETRTALSYQLDIQTQSCTDDEDTVLSMYDAGRVLVAEVTDLLDSALSITRRSCIHRPVATDVLEHVWRGDCVADSEGYSYRP